MTGEHVIAVARRPVLHKDPFDRLLVAQAAAASARRDPQYLAGVDAVRVLQHRRLASEIFTQA
jgi:PIN domain nuclease of toxin-antitoxin system